MKYLKVALSAGQAVKVMVLIIRENILAWKKAESDPKFARGSDFKIPGELNAMVSKIIEEANWQEGLTLTLTRQQAKYLKTKFEGRILTLMTRTLPEYELRAKKNGMYLEKIQRTKDLAKTFKEIIEEIQAHL